MGSDVLSGRSGDNPRYHLVMPPAIAAQLTSLRSLINRLGAEPHGHAGQSRETLPAGHTDGSVPPDLFWLASRLRPLKERELQGSTGR